MFLGTLDAYYYALLATSMYQLGFIGWLVLRALNNPGLFVAVLSTERIKSSAASVSVENELSLTPEEIQTQIEQLNSYVFERKPYLNAELTIYDLSHQVGISVKNLSLILNHKLKKHFFDFINEFRIEQAKEILRDPEKNQFTVLEILYDVGFNSKSSFNTAFKKYERVTPTEYRKKNLISV